MLIGVRMRRLAACRLRDDCVMRGRRRLLGA